MDLLCLSTEWILCLNNELISSKFVLLEPNKIKIITNNNMIFDYKEKNKKIHLFYKNTLFAVIEKYNQKTLLYTEYKNGNKICEALMF